MKKPAKFKRSVCQAWFPDFVRDAVDHCLKKPTVQFLDNLCSLVELQSRESSLPDTMTSVTKLADTLGECHLPLLNLVSVERQCLPNVLKMFDYVALPRHVGLLLNCAGLYIEIWRKVL